MTSAHEAASIARARLHALAREHGVELGPARVKMRMDGEPARTWVERELGVVGW